MPIFVQISGCFIRTNIKLNYMLAKIEGDHYYPFLFVNNFLIAIGWTFSFFFLAGEGNY